MPVGFSSAARNLFLLGSTGAATVTNFFLELDKSSTAYSQWKPQGIHYNASDQTYINLLQTSSNGYDLTLEKVQQDGTVDWTSNAFNTSNTNNSSLYITSLHVDSNGDILAAGNNGSVDNLPVVLKYTTGGSLTWTTTSTSANVTYQSLTSDSNNNYYACGMTPSTGFNNDAVAFVEKFDVDGSPLWGKSAFMLGRNVKLNDIAVNDRGEVVAVGSLEDDSNDKGYIVKIDTSTGSVLWDRTLDSIGTQDITIEEVFIDTKDQIYVAGKNGSFISEAFLIKYTPEGNIIWQKQTQAAESATYGKSYRPVGLRSDGETEQTVVLHDVFDTDLAVEIGAESANYLAVSKYSKDGSLVWRRNIQKTSDDDIYYGNLDADPSFYYINFKKLSNTHNKYIFGKVSSSGNGLGNFSYDDGSTDDIEYTISDVTDTIGRLSDGSVRNDTSDLMTYPFGANQLVFDDLATHVSNKRRQMDSADSFEYSGSPAIRVADFQELNLLGENVSDRIWTDTSGKGNNGVSSLTEPFFGAGSVSFDGTGDSISVGPLLPTSTGTAFTVDMFWRSTSNTSQTCLWEQHNSGSGRTAYFINGTNAFLISEGNTVGSFAYSDNVWYFTRVTYTAGGEIEVFVNGVSRGTGTQTVGVDNVNFVIGDRSGANESFNGYISNCRVVVGSALNGTEVPTTPLTAITGTELLTCQGDTIADASANNFTITVNGNAAPTDDGPTHNAAGYWEFDGTDDKIIGPPCNTILSADSSIELWVNFDDVTTRQTIISGYDSTPNTDPNRWDFEMSAGTFRGGFHDNGYFTSSTSISIGAWNHVMLVLNSSTNTLKFYLNGLEDLSQSCSNFNFGGPDINLGIGNRNESVVGPMDGKIGEVRIYPRALTAEQVYQNYNATKSKWDSMNLGAPFTAPRIGSDNIKYSNLLLSYDFANRATYDRVENRYTSSTNLLKFSDGTSFGRLTDWSWLGSTPPTITPNAAIAPDGSLTAFKISGASLYQSIINDGDFTISAWVKTVDGSSASVQQSVYLLNTGGEVLSTNHTATGEWQRFTFSGVATSEYGSPAGEYHRYTPFASTSELYVWGPQVELKSSAGRHIQTYGTAITPPEKVNNLASSLYNSIMDSSNQFDDGTIVFTGAGGQYLYTGYDNVIVSDGSSSTVSWTFECWIKPDAFTGSSDIADLTSNGTYKIQLEQGGSDAGKIRYQNSVNTSGFSFNAITAGQWNHLVVKFSPFALATSVSIQAWMNNVFALNTGHSEPLQTNLYLIGSGFKGRMAEVRIYDTDISDVEREGNWNATRGKYGL